MSDPTVEFGFDAFMESFSVFEQSGEGIHLQNAIQHGQAALSQRSSESSDRIIKISICLAELSWDIYNQNFDLASLENTIKYN